MSAVSPYTGVGRLLDEAVRECVLEWCKRKMTNVPLQECLGADVTSITTETTLFPGGLLTVSIQVRGRRDWDDEWYLFRFKRRRPGVWDRAGSSLG